MNTQRYQTSIYGIMILVCLGLILAGTPVQAAWHNLGTGMEEQVRALAVGSDGTLYAGGHFQTAGTKTALRVAYWNGTEWNPMGNAPENGMNSDVYALVVGGSSGTLYAGGNFTTAGTATANYVAYWNGTQWSGLVYNANGMSSKVFALAYANGTLYAGGEFTTAGGVTANHVASWNGTQWSALGSGMAGVVNALAYANGTLYAGDSNGTVAGWNGTWSSLGTMSGEVTALTYGNSTLYAADVTGRVAYWTGTQWQNLGSGMNASVFALTIGSDGKLYAGGAFTMAGGVAANRVARWNGTTWEALGEGISNNQVRTLAIGSKGEIYAGGTFTTADIIPAYPIAKWTEDNSYLLWTK